MEVLAMMVEARKDFVEIYLFPLNLYSLRNVK